MTHIMTAFKQVWRKVSSGRKKFLFKNGVFFQFLGLECKVLNVSSFLGVYVFTCRMGCGSSKNQFKEDENNIVVGSSENLADTRVFRENVTVENDAVYSGEFVNGRKDGQGTQKCMH